MRPAWALVLIAIVILIGMKIFALSGLAVGVMFVGAAAIYLIILMED